jgi:hypothetical protein
VDVIHPLSDYERAFDSGSDEQPRLVALADADCLEGIVSLALKQEDPRDFTYMRLPTVVTEGAEHLQQDIKIAIDRKEHLEQVGVLNRESMAIVYDCTSILEKAGLHCRISS